MPQRVLTYPDPAVQGAAQTVLDDERVLALAGKKKSPKKKRKQAPPKTARGAVLVIAAGGFAAYASDERELAATSTNAWGPQTRDFAATFKKPGTLYEAGTVGQFFGAILDQSGTIARIVFIGHGSEYGIGLSGHQDGGILRFDEKITAEVLDENVGLIQQQAEKLHPEATIDLVCCNAGAGGEFLKRLANTFRRCVQGFGGDVRWEYPLNDDRTAIADDRRGRTTYGDAPFKPGYRHLRFDRKVCPDPPPGAAP